MRNLSSVLKSALIIGAALGTAAFVWYKTRDEEEEKDEVSDTMILVYVLNPFYQSPVATLRHDGYRYDTEGNGRRGGV